MEKYKTWFKRQEEKYHNVIEIMDKVNAHWTLDDIINSSRDLPSITTNIRMIETLAQSYGEFYLAITRECDAEIARFAYTHPNVIAVLAEDTDFLIFPSKQDWKYISINKLDPNTLHSKEYSRKALRDYLNLNDEELMILSTLGGNDIIRFEEVEEFHKSLVGRSNFYKDRFLQLASLIKNLPKGRAELKKKIASTAFGSTKQGILDKIEDSFEFYNVVG